MKFVIIGGTGLIGRQVFNNLRVKGHEVIAASPSSGVNSLTGEGLDEAMKGADVAIDVANSPSFEDKAVLHFFQTATQNLLRAEVNANVKHHVALSVVGADRLPESGYLRAKIAQEDLIRLGAVPYTIVRATQFYEFLGMIADTNSANGIVRVPTAELQPIAARDVAAAVADAALMPAANQMIEVAGPQRLPLDELIRRYLAATGDGRPVIGDPATRYFGARLSDTSLTPDRDARIAAMGFDTWLDLVVARNANRLTPA